MKATEYKAIKQLAASNAIKQLGGNTAAAEKISVLTGHEVSRYRVNHWRKQGIQPRFCPAVHQLTKIPLSQLDPEVYPVYLFAS